MKVIEARNINDAWDQAKVVLNNNHIKRPSRVGEVIEYPTPVTTVYNKPTERVLFDSRRNANPFFHVMESLWMIAGRNDVEWLVRFNERMREFSDDGKTFHGAYGYRWRFAFDMDGGAEDDFADQLPKIVRMLRKSPEERRCVLQMWNAVTDLERPDAKDVPCNTQCYFKIRDGCLTMTVCCRSNDIAWGAYGANAVHFSFLQEYMASMIGVPIGPMYQISDSWHAYTERWDPLFGGLDETPSLDYYSMDSYVKPYPLVTSPETFDAELRFWVEESFSDPKKAGFGPERNGYENHFFPMVAQLLLESWNAYKTGDLRSAEHLASRCAARDWSLAATEWLGRIRIKRDKKLVYSPEMK